MLQQLVIRGYRSVKDLELTFPKERPLVLIGENASGKSNILDACALLAAFPLGRGGDAIYDRGGWDAVSWAGQSREIEFVVRFAPDFKLFAIDGAPVEYALKLGRVRSQTSVLSETVKVYKRGLDSPPLTVFSGGATPWALSVVTQTREEIATNSDNPRIGIDSALAGISDTQRYPTLVRVKQALETIRFYPGFSLSNMLIGEEYKSEALNPRPTEHVVRVKHSGRNLLNALHTLSQSGSRAWGELQNDLRAVFPWCRDLRFPPGAGRGLIAMTWSDSRSGATLQLEDMSEGMRVYLALLAALHAEDSPALLAFDEPERSLHPVALRRMMKVFESRAERTSILIATHSDRLLDSIEDPADVLRIVRFVGQEGTKAEPLDRDLLGAWLREYSMSELRSRDMLDTPGNVDENDAAPRGALS